MRHKPLRGKHLAIPKLLRLAGVGSTWTWQPLTNKRGCPLVSATKTRAMRQGPAWWAVPLSLLVHCFPASQIESLAGNRTVSCHLLSHPKQKRRAGPSRWTISSPAVGSEGSWEDGDNQDPPFLSSALSFVLQGHKWTWNSSSCA